MTDDIIERLQRIEAVLQELLEQRKIKEWYSIAETAAILGKAPWTVREWARSSRINAEKRAYGRGNTKEWMVSHDELTRIQNKGLLPDPTRYRHLR